MSNHVGFHISIEIFILVNIHTNKSIILALHQIINLYMNIIEKAWISIIIMISTFLFHLLFLYLFINILDLSVFGAGLASTLKFLCSFLLELGYVNIFTPQPESFFFFNKESFELKGISEFLLFYVNLLPIDFCKYASIEIQTILSFGLGKTYLAAHVILQTIA